MGRALALAALAALGTTACEAGNGRAERDPNAVDGGIGRIGDERRGRPDETDPKGAEAAAPAAPEPPAQQAASGQGDPTSQPANGSAQRRAILDALRPAIQTELRGPVEFVVSRIAVDSGWALVIAEPQHPGGGAVDTSGLSPEEERDGITVYAILRFRNGRWNLVDHAIGPTDVWYCGLEGPPTSLTGC